MAKNNCFLGNGLKKDKGKFNTINTINTPYYNSISANIYLICYISYICNSQDALLRVLRVLRRTDGFC